MPNYQNGKIYKITSPSTDKIYIGSTTQQLNSRFSDHKSCYNTGLNKSSAKIIQYNDCIIELIEEYPCESKRELEHREQFYMDLYSEIIVNQNNTIGNKKADSDKFKNSQKYKDWYETNKETLNAKKRIHHHKHKEKNNERSRKYTQDHREELNQKKKEYYEENKETINEKKRIAYKLDKEKVLKRNRIYKEKNKEELNKKQKVSYEKNKEKYNEKQRLRMNYQNSWGGDKRSNNNLLEIDTDLFN